MKAIINGQFILEDKILNSHYVLFDTHIQEIGSMEAWGEAKESKCSEVIDVSGDYVSPGFIDIHIHGYKGFDTMDATREALEVMASSLAKHGVTSFLATTMTMDTKSIQKALANVSDYMEDPASEGARILGVHLEGPFIHPQKKGAQNADYIQKPNLELIQDHLPIIRLITFAPDVDGAFSWIEEMKAYPHIHLAMGHTCVDFETAEKAYEKGVKHITHCFNAMPALHHREPGLIGAMMTGKYSAELIADKVHVHPGLFLGLTRAAGEDNLVLVSDCMCAGGLEDGAYKLGGQPVEVKNGEARLKEDGSLAGSVLKLDEALRNYIQATQAPLYEAIKKLSLNPAKVIGLSSEYGSIDKGKRADFVILSQTLEVKKTIISR